MRDYGQDIAEIHRPGGDAEAAAEATEEGPRPDTLEDPAGQAEVGRSRPPRLHPQDPAPTGSPGTTGDLCDASRHSEVIRSLNVCAHYVTERTTLSDSY